MLPQGHSQPMERGLTHQRRQQQGGGPCPRGNGTTVGTFQEFTVLCNTNFEGEGTVLDRLDAFDFVACMDICSSFHPRCDGASYDGSRCTLLSRVQANNGNQFSRFSRNTDSGIASFPGASSNCATLGQTQRVLDTTNFNIMCGFVIAGSDISQNFAPTFQDCLGQCAATSGCAAVSFDPSQELGFKNCYLKTGVGEPGNVVADRRTDSATVAAAAAPAPGGAGVATVPVPSPTNVATGNGVVFFTPPGGIASASPTSIEIPPPAPTITTPLVLDVSSDIPATPSSSTDDAAPPFFFPGTSTRSPVPETTAGTETVGGAEGFETNNTSSNAWIAAPVVGSVAAIALIVISIIMLKRRRRSSSSSGQRIEKPSISRPSPISGFFTGLIPIAYRKSTASASSSSLSSTERQTRKMGNYSEATRAERDSSVRNSVAGFLTGRPAGMERLEDIEEGTGTPRAATKEGTVPVYEIKNGKAVQLRNSLNGLGQNRWS
ncbi:hypothetical protein QBC35DRAFT_142032 [Podospora australis]|uniref:Apple domain-containing protein n=1 Tax=Podospora australis TaxID=1536484 RepID=A0AAN7AKK6_9PEZI|nr:hypothetical protein QBC35DRAFT_142032 [Podospora australis]